jgi:hypothetical protein
MQAVSSRKTTPVQYLIFGASLMLLAAMFVYLASRLDVNDSRLAYDWKIFWHSMENGHMRWDLKMFNPPWVVLFLLPLGFLPLSAGWGLLIFFTFTVLVFSVPPQYGHKRHLAGIVLLCTSFSTLRLLMEGNLEAIAVAAILALVYAYQNRLLLPFVLAALLCTVKPQIVFLFVPVVALYTVQTQERRFTVTASAAIAAIVVLSVVWAGKPWLEAMDEQQFTYGMSLRETGERIGIPLLWIVPVQAVVILVTLFIAYRGNRDFSREKLGLLISGSLLASPFSNGHSMLVLLALGILPLALARPRYGVPLFILFEIPYLMLLAGITGSTNSYWTLVLIVCWPIFGALVYRGEYRSARPETDPAGA